MNALEVRTINQWPADKYDDTQLAILIELYRGIAQEHCNNTFPDGSEPMGVKKFIADSIKHCETSGVASKSMGSVSISFDTNLPAAIYDHLAPFRKLRWR
ncbi:phage head-tail adapter protein [Macrococcus brunensis]|uniref:phage head-tail adapter protein n=1 Tax=Macrococcus brunensis TaxID=198483 RepID=UPI001EF0E9CD|nr:phage head-tail adapter protein [Macrococcus brunensis]ULG73216.1 phage head-tail adapter protein [Macrococcus brunensis]